MVHSDSFLWFAGLALYGIGVP